MSINPGVDFLHLQRYLQFVFFSQLHAILFLPYARGSNLLLRPPQCTPLHITGTHIHVHTVLCCFVSTHSPENSQEHCTQTAFPGLSSSLWPPSHKTTKTKDRRRKWEEERKWMTLVSTPASERKNTLIVLRLTLKLPLHLKQRCDFQ